MDDRLGCTLSQIHAHIHIHKYIHQSRRTWARGGSRSGSTAWARRGSRPSTTAAVEVDVWMCDMHVDVRVIECVLLRIRVCLGPAQPESNSATHTHNTRPDPKPGKKNTNAPRPSRGSPCRSHGPFASSRPCCLGLGAGTALCRARWCWWG